MSVTSLVGFTTERGGYSKHFREEQILPDGRSNLYPGPVPLEDMHKFLFGWHAVKAPVSVEVNGELVPTDKFKAIVRSDTHETLGVHKPGYTIHQPSAFLLENMQRLAGEDVPFAGGGLIRGGAVGYAEITLPEPVEQSSLGIRFRPNIVGFTSFDASRSSDYVQAARLLICDNQFPALAKAARLTGLSYRHTINSLARADADMAVAHRVLQEAASEFLATAVRLAHIIIRPAARERFLDLWAPLPLEDGRGLTVATNRREQFIDVLTNDPAVAPFSGNAFGLLQAANTFQHHYGEVRGRTREIANADRVITGRQAKLDSRTLEYIDAAVI
jgi:phage/plasmid-like protein (TIGR03299 family)